MWTVKQFSLASTRPTAHTQWGAGMVCGPNGVSNALWGLPGPAPWLYKLGHSSKSSLWYPEGAGALIPLYTLTACLLAMPSSLSFSPGSGLYHLPWCLVLWSQSPYTGCISDIQEIGGREGCGRSLSQQSPPAPSLEPGYFWCHFSPVLNPSAPRTGQEEGNPSLLMPAPSSSLLPGSSFEAQQEGFPPFTSGSSIFL